MYNIRLFAEKMNSMVHFVGYYSIFLVALYGVVGLANRGSVVWFYLAFVWMNEWLNRLLKPVLRDPRPREVETDKRDSNYYGMPSGHMQHVGFGWMYLYLMGVPYAAEMLGAIVGLTAYQRYTSRSHTMEQIIVGLGVGVLLGYAAYAVTPFLRHFLRDK